MVIHKMEINKNNSIYSQINYNLMTHEIPRCEGVNSAIISPDANTAKISKVMQPWESCDIIVFKFCNLLHRAQWKGKQNCSVSRLRFLRSWHIYVNKYLKCDLYLKKKYECIGSRLKKGIVYIWYSYQNHCKFL